MLEKRHMYAKVDTIDYSTCTDKSTSIVRRQIFALISGWCMMIVIFKKNFGGYQGLNKKMRPWRC